MASRVTEVSESAVKTVKGVIEEIQVVNQRSLETTAKIRELADSVKGITGFVATISQIADQTNLLALNAAIEAARAGEAGRGFAVVAEEVRKLAEESAGAARSIADLAATITRDLDGVFASVGRNAESSLESSTLAEDTEGKIDQMIRRLDQIAQATQDLAAVSQEQAASAEEIASAVQDVAGKVSQGSEEAARVRSRLDDVGRAAASVERGTEELGTLSGQLRDLVGAFRFQEDAPSSGGLPALGAGRRR